MLVSSGKGRSYWRQPKEARIRRNGSFLDIWFEDDGQLKWIGIVEKDIRAFLDAGVDEETIGIHFDEAADEVTALRDFMRRKSLSDLRDD